MKQRWNFEKMLCSVVIFYSPNVHVIAKSCKCVCHYNDFYIDTEILMKGLDILALLLSITSTQSCLTDESQFSSTVVTSEYVTGYPVVCVNGTFAPICNQETIGITELMELCYPFYDNITGQCTVMFVFM